MLQLLQLLLLLDGEASVIGLGGKNIVCRRDCRKK